MTYDFVVEVHVVDVEGYVLLCLPVNLFVELLFRHRWKQYLFDNDCVTRKRRGHLIGLYVLLVPDSTDRVAYVIEVDYVSVNDGVGLKILMRDVDQLEPVARELELDRLQRTRPDVESNDALLLFA